MSRTRSASPRNDESPQIPAGHGGRDANGRFTKGNPGGPGNPFTRRVAEFRAAIVAAATPEKVAAVVAKLEEKALQGDVAAAKLYLAYAVGRPGPAPDPDRLDFEEGRQVQQEMTLFGLLARAVGYPLLETMLDMVRTGRPVASDGFLKKLRDGIAAIDAAEQEAPSANGENGGDAPAAQGASEETVAPSGNGANCGGDPRPPRGRQQDDPSGQRRTKGNPDSPPPTANGPNGESARRARRPGAWVPPWEDGWGDGPPPGGGANRRP
jgi:hypothetical protein